MNHFIKSIFLTSLAKIWPWMRISLIGIIFGIILCGFWIWVNPNMKFIYYDMVTINRSTYWGIIGIVAAKLIMISLITIICLFIPSNKYGIALGKILILLISVYLGIIFVLSIKSASDDYLSVIYLSVQEFSVLWCLSIGTLKTKFIEKTKLAIIPFLLLATVSICQAFF